jgi:hypothetical protein
MYSMIRIGCRTHTATGDPSDPASRSPAPRPRAIVIAPLSLCMPSSLETGPPLPCGAGYIFASIYSCPTVPRAAVVGPRRAPCTRVLRSSLIARLFRLCVTKLSGPRTRETARRTLSPPCAVWLRPGVRPRSPSRVCARRTRSPELEPTPYRVYPTQRGGVALQGAKSFQSAFRVV